MTIYGPLRALLFIYECFRLMIMMSILTVLGPWNGSSGDDGFPDMVFPYIVYLVPNALFLLMTFFLWIRFSVYKPYIALYMAGKTIFVISVIGWCIFSFHSIIRYFMTETVGMVTVGVMLLLAVTDTLSILGGLMLQNKLNRLKALDDKGVVPGFEAHAPENGGL